MKSTQQFILLEIAIAAWVMIGAGLIIYRGSRRAAEAKTESLPAGGYQFGGRDLVLALGLCWIFMSLTIASGFAAKERVAVAELPVSGMVLSLLLQGLQVYAILAFLMLGRRVSPVEVFGIRKHSLLKTCGLAVGMLVPVAAIAILLAQFLKGWGIEAGWDFKEQEAVQMLRSSADPKAQALLIAIACVGAPVMEELLFRGMIYNGLKRFTDTWFALIASSLLFAVMHGHLLTLPPLFLLGFFFALAYQVTGSLLVCIFMHLLFNAAQVLQILLLHDSSS